MHVERFNRSYREDILDKYLFDNLHQVRSLSHYWQWLFNNDLLHDIQDRITPTEALLKLGKRTQTNPMKLFSTFQQDRDNDELVSFLFILLWGWLRMEHGLYNYRYFSDHEKIQGVCPGGHGEVSVGGADCLYLAVKCESMTGAFPDF